MRQHTYKRKATAEVPGQYFREPQFSNIQAYTHCSFFSASKIEGISRDTCLGCYQDTEVQNLKCIWNQGKKSFHRTIVFCSCTGQIRVPSL